MSELLEQIGMTKDELCKRVVDAALASIMQEHVSDEDGVFYKRESGFHRAMKSKVVEAINAKVNEIGDSVVVPEIGTLVNKLCLQATNQWGEPTGEPLTFTEYMVKRTEAYIDEPVDFQGNPKRDQYNWKASTTRISYLVNQYLQYRIDSAMKETLKNANEILVGGIEEAVKIKLNEIASMLKVTVSTKS